MNRRVIWVLLDGPKSERYSAFKKACCQFVRYPQWADHNGYLLIDFLDEFHSITKDDISLSKSNILEALSPYFKTITFL